MHGKPLPPRPPAPPRASRGPGSGAARRPPLRTAPAGSASRRRRERSRGRVGAGDRDGRRPARRLRPGSPSRRDHPATRAEAARRSTGLVLDRDERPLVGEAEAWARSSCPRRARAALAPAPPRAARAALARPRGRGSSGASRPVGSGEAPRLRRSASARPARGRLSTSPRSRGTRRPCARASGNDVRASQPSSALALSVEPMWRSTWPMRSGTFTLSEAGLPSASST